MVVVVVISLPRGAWPLCDLPLSLPMVDVSTFVVSDLISLVCEAQFSGCLDSRLSLELFFGVFSGDFWSASERWVKLF